MQMNQLDFFRCMVIDARNKLAVFSVALKGAEKGSWCDSGTDPPL
jgi:hypothetical protein